MIKLFRIILLAVVVTCVSATLGCTEPDRPTIFVSMVQLLAHPNDYDGYPVTVTGHLARDGSILFLSAEHAEMDDVVGGLPISIAYRNVDVSEHGIPNTGCEDRFVRILGIFEKRANEFIITSVSKISMYDESAGLEFEGEGPFGGSVVCWPN